MRWKGRVFHQLYLQLIEPICNKLLRLKLNRHERQSETTRHVRLRRGKGFMIRFDSVPDWSTTPYIDKYTVRMKFKKTLIIAVVFNLSTQLKQV